MSDQLDRACEAAWTSDPRQPLAWAAVRDLGIGDRRRRDVAAALRIMADDLRAQPTFVTDAGARVLPVQFLNRVLDAYTGGES